MNARQVAVEITKQRGGPDCRVCRWEAPRRTMMHAHHVVPISKGGTNERTNLVQLCPNCHALAHYEYRLGSRPDTVLDLIAILRKYHRRPDVNRRMTCHILPVYELDLRSA